MSNLWQKTTRYYMDEEEVCNAISVFSHAIEDEEDERRRIFFEGVRAVFIHMQQADRMQAAYLFRDVLVNELDGGYDIGA